MIDGPYGAPAQDYKDYEVVLLVGLGIGATPMISIIKDIVNNMKYNEADDPECGISTTATATNSSHNKGSIHPRNNMRSDLKMKRAYFYWVTRVPGSFEWFKEEMIEVEKMDIKGVLELHNHFTGYGKEDARASLIAAIQCLDQAKNGVDIVSGTSIKFHFRRPNWHDVYKRISRNF
ncbi:hypothetical protein C5167_021162 [Papaver somniferum]|uniref:Ferric reductase NAD binding domain-containing protein n=1 Tax=Papaver somniferum TaxID=3469 RepID=A0A4Y7IVL9_PAPSO|nr:hypothetical protein C5167_021162 [Papaver somniferum]